MTSVRHTASVPNGVQIHSFPPSRLLQRMSNMTRIPLTDSPGSAYYCSEFQQAITSHRVPPGKAAKFPNFTCPHHRSSFQPKAGGSIYRRECYFAHTEDLSSSNFTFYIFKLRKVAKLHVSVHTAFLVEFQDRSVEFHDTERFVYNFRRVRKIA